MPTLEHQIILIQFNFDFREVRLLGGRHITIVLQPLQGPKISSYVTAQPRLKSYIGPHVGGC